MIKAGDEIKNAEIIIVNDGSKDKTLEIAFRYSKEVKPETKIEIRVVDLVYNQGKGAAVKYVTLSQIMCRDHFKQEANTLSSWMLMEQLTSMNFQSF